MHEPRTKFLAFDLETANLTSFEQEEGVGICCWAVASYASSIGKIRAQCGHGRLDNGRPSPCMSQEECRDLVDKLLTATDERGFVLLTHNGIGFDLKILAQESGRWEECRHLALHSIDMMLHFHCIRGFSVGLDAAAKGLGLSGKTDGISGGAVPKMWEEGKFEEVLGYVKQDAITTLEVGMEVERRGELLWITKKGHRKRQKIGKWLGMVEALRLPIPNTSWMDDPRPRETLIQWMEEK